MATRVMAPDGVQINFPDSMGDDEIKQVMRKKYPPRTVMQPSNSERQGELKGLMPTMPQFVPEGLGGNPQGYLHDESGRNVIADTGANKGQPITSAEAAQARGTLEDIFGLKTPVQTGVKSALGNVYPGGEGLFDVGSGSVKLAKARTKKERYQAGSEIASGAMNAATPLGAAAAIESPLSTGAFIIGSTGLGTGTEKAASAMGASPEAAEFAGSLAMAAPMLYGFGKGFKGETPTEAPKKGEPVLGESDVDFETRGAGAPTPAASLDSVIDNAEMRWKNAPPLSNKKANLLDVLDQHLQARLAEPKTVNPEEVQPNSASAPMIRNVANLMEASEMKEAPETPEAKQVARERYLNLTKQPGMGPSKTYDPVTGKPVSPKTGSDDYLKFPETQASASAADTDFMGKALADRYPGKSYGDLTSEQQSEVIQRAQQFKDAPKNQGLGPTGPFKAPPAGMEGQRGSLWFKPKNVPNSSTPMGQLTDRIQAGLGTRPPTGDRLSWAEKLADAYGPTGDAIKEGLAKLTAHTAALVDKYRRPSAYTDYNRAVGEFSGDLNSNALESRRFVKRIMHDAPDKLRREAITNYVQANGDRQTLENWANAPRVAKTPEAQKIQDRLVRGYKAALDLTPAEQRLAHDIRGYFDNQLHEAQSSGMLAQGIDNYVNQIWKKGEGPRTLTADAYNNELRPNASFMKKRFFESYFEGEQAGYIPKSKDVGYLLASYNKSFNQALASRAFISKLAAGKKVNGKWTGALADDGKPIIAAPASLGKEVTNPDGETTHLVFPRVSPEEELVSDTKATQGQRYKTIDHPALSGWKWAGSSENENILVKGQLQVHPDFYNDLNNVLSDSKLKGPGIVRGALKLNSTMKQTLLSFSAFHQTQEGLHSIFHGKSPFNPPEIDLNSDVHNKLLDHGLVIGGNTGIQDFTEGLHGSGLTKFIPIAGPAMAKYTDYLFNDYIPRLKMQMAQAAVEKNLKRYGKDGWEGKKLNEDQIYRLSAEQANAAFGELNYKMLGRNPSVQDAMRFVVLAPDFLEARARFVGQALKPYGQEQRMALIRGAAGLYVGARILNKLLDDDYHFDTPFSVVYGDKEYTLRSIPGDVYHLATDPRSFVNHRISPIARGVGEILTGKDEFGRKRDFDAQAIDFLKNVIPIPFQASAQKKMEKGFSEQTGIDSGLSAIGITSRKYRTPAERLAHQYMLDGLPANHESRGIGYMADKMRQGNFDGDEASQLIHDGRLTTKDIVSAMNMAKGTPLAGDFEGLRLNQAIEVYAIASEQEKAQLHKGFVKKILSMREMPREQQEEAQKRLDKLK